MQSTICININTKNLSFFTWNFYWINHKNQDRFNEFTKYLRFNSSYIHIADTFLTRFQGSKVNCIHISNEHDALTHWSKYNGMTYNKFKESLESIYISLIEKYIPKSETLVILTCNRESPIVEYLKNNQYTYIFTETFFKGPEENAIVDLIIGSRTDNVFIGNFNTTLLRGSSFSYSLLQLMNINSKKVLIDLESILSDAIII